MKRLHKIFLAFGFVGLLLLTSCDKNFDKINTNPDSPEEVPTPYLMTRLQRNLAFEFYGIWRGVRIPGLCSQHWTQRNYTEEDRYTFRVSNDDSMFRNLYIYMQNANSIIELNKNRDPEVAAYGDNDMQTGTAMLMKLWGLQLATETFGDVPYTEAYTYKSGDEMPKYDTQEDIFKFLERDIKEAVSLLLKAKATGKNTSWASPTTGGPSCDIIFNGNIDKWIKFGNSLLLRLAIRQSNVNPNWQALATEAINAPGGLMASNDDNATFKFTGPGIPTQASIYTGFFVDGRNDFTMSWQLANLMKGENDAKKGFTNPVYGLKDPRFEVYVGPTNVDANRFDGLPYGLPTSANNAFVKNNTKTLINLKDKEDNSTIVLSTKFWSTFLDYANVEFILAEINSSSTNLENALNASMEMWGATNYAAFVTAVVDKFNAADAEGKKEIILTEKYIHNFAHYSNEAWSELRRTGYPKSVISPGQVTAVIDGTEYKFNPTVPVTTIATRMKYPISEDTSNKENLKKAINNMGGFDNVGVPLWWMPKTAQ